MPKDKVEKESESKSGPWNIPARIFIGTSFILLLTGLPHILVHA
jgi:hypothetical protein